MSKRNDKWTMHEFFSMQEGGPRVSVGYFIMQGDRVIGKFIEKRDAQMIVRAVNRVQ